MAHLAVVLAVIASASYVVFLIIDHFVTESRIKAKAKEWGCEEPRREKIPGLLGSIGLVRRAMKADKEKRFPQFTTERAKAVGAWTWTYTLFGSRLIATAEPENIQAILATQFGTFDLGPLRRNLVSEQRTQRTQRTHW